MAKFYLLKTWWLGILSLGLACLLGQWHSFVFGSGLHIKLLSQWVERDCKLILALIACLQKSLARLTLPVRPLLPIAGEERTNSLPVCFLVLLLGKDAYLP